MKLLIISNMQHHRRDDGRIVGHGATVRELDHLATLFSEVRHLACLHDGAPPAGELAYAGDRIELLPLPPSGGDAWRDKLGILRHTPRYLRAIGAALPWADVVHVRCPANLSLYAVAMLPTVRRPQRRWVKYAGSWQPYPGESRPTALQRHMLRGTWHGAEVTVNGAWPDQPAHVHTFDNPCLTDDEIATGAAIAATKRTPGAPHLIFVGGLEPAKGADVALEAVEILRARGIAATLEIVGDGTQRAALEQRAGSHVRFAGWLPRPALAEPYGRAHFAILPSRTEGWPKVLSEAMAYGAVPIASSVGSIPQILGENGAGVAIESRTAAAYADAIAAYTVERWLRESRAGVRGATRFSYATYLARVRAMLKLEAG